MTRRLTTKEKQYAKRENKEHQNRNLEYLSKTKPDPKARENFRRKPYDLGGE